MEPDHVAQLVRGHGLDIELFGIGGIERGVAVPGTTVAPAEATMPMSPTCPPSTRTVTVAPGLPLKARSMRH